MQRGAGLVVAALLHVPARRVGQGEDGQDQQDPGDGRDAQHHPPFVPVDQQIVGEVGDEDADGDGQLVEGHHPAPDPARSQFGGVEGCGHRGHTDAEPHQQPADDQDARARCQGLDQGAGDEQPGGEHDGPPATHPVGQASCHQRSRHGAEGHPAGDDLQEERPHRELLLDPVQGTRDDPLVVAEQQPGQHDDQSYAQQVDARHPSGPPSVTRAGAARICSARVSAARVCSARVCAAWICSARVWAARMWAARMWRLLPRPPVGSCRHRSPFHRPTAPPSGTLRRPALRDTVTSRASRLSRPSGTSGSR